MIFLSYSRLNKDVAHKLEGEMREVGIPYQRDITLVEGDAFWRRDIRSALDRCAVLVVLWSNEAYQSPYVDQEIRAFKRHIIFVALDDTPVPTKNCSVITPRQIIKVLRETVRERVTSKPDNLSNDAVYEAMRQRRLIEEENRLQQFIRQSARNAELTGDKIINQRDGTELKQVENFYLAVDPVTNAQYEKFIDATGYPPPPTWNRANFSLPDAPVTGVTWFEARAYAAWVGGTLPAELDWEKAARGNHQVCYATATGELDPTLAHYGFNLDEGAPCPVRLFPSNQSGFRGMCGNVWDWCMNPAGLHRIIKGGGYMDRETFCHIAARYYNFPIDRDCCVGFRVKIDLQAV